ncbi:hypothetical protein [Aerosakkonema funiforme]|nr:hypothetical protein [Aerosakkonema funiforme]
MPLDLGNGINNLKKKWQTIRDYHVGALKHGFTEAFPLELW